MRRLISFFVLSVFAMTLFAQSVMVPIAYYLSNAKTGSVSLPSTQLTHFYFPAKASVSLDSQWSKNITVNTSTNKSGGGSGSGVSQFSLSINDTSNQDIYVYLRGQSNGAWQTACEITATSSGVNYTSACVSTGIVNSPIGLPYQLYVARNSFSSLSVFEQVATPYQCTSLVPNLASVDDKHIVSLNQPIAYSLTVNNDTCTISKG